MNRILWDHILNHFNCILKRSWIGFNGFPVSFNRLHSPREGWSHFLKLNLFFSSTMTSTCPRWLEEWWDVSVHLQTICFYSLPKVPCLFISWYAMAKLRPEIYYHMQLDVFPRCCLSAFSNLFWFHSFIKRETGVWRRASMSEHFWNQWENIWSYALLTVILPDVMSIDKMLGKLAAQSLDIPLKQKNTIPDAFHSFVHYRDLYSASSRLLLRSAPDPCTDPCFITCFMVNKKEIHRKTNIVCSCMIFLNLCGTACSSDHSVVVDRQYK